MKCDLFKETRVSDNQVTSSKDCFALRVDFHTIFSLSEKLYFLMEMRTNPSWVSVLM